MENSSNSRKDASRLLETDLENGFYMIEFQGYSGEGDFMLIYNIINRLIKPEKIGYGVDSLCVMGSFVKDGISVRMSSEGITDNVSLVYKKDGLSDADLEKIRSWARLVDSELQKAV